MARRKKRKNPIKTFLTLTVILVSVLFGVAKYCYPEKATEVQQWVQSQVERHTNKGTVIATVAPTGTDIATENYLPTVSDKIQVLKNIGYISAFSNDLSVPIWVGYVATYPFKFDTVKRPSSFIHDTRAYGSAEHRDYSNTGYDRGHMAPNYVIGRCYGEKAQMETFLLTNIVPQKPNMNRGVWCDIEQYIANNLSKKYGKVLVFVGPIFKGNIAKLKGKVAIPTACYAVVMVMSKSREISAIGFIVPQSPTKKSIWDYCVPIDEIERLTGIDFLPQLPDEIENKVESSTSITAFR